MIVTSQRSWLNHRPGDPSSIVFLRSSVWRLILQEVMAICTLCWRRSYVDRGLIMTWSLHDRGAIVGDRYFLHDHQIDNSSRVTWRIIEMAGDNFKCIGWQVWYVSRELYLYLLPSNTFYTLSSHLNWPIIDCTQQKNSTHHRNFHKLQNNTDKRHFPHASMWLIGNS